MPLLLLYALPWSFRLCSTWIDGKPAVWEVLIEPGTTMARSSDSIQGDFSVQMNTTDSYGIYLRQEIWINESVRHSVLLGLVFRIDEIDDIDSSGSTA